MDERTFELINLVVDGQAKADEQIELQKRLDQAPDDQALFDDIRHLARELDAQPHIAPPPEARQSVMDAVRVWSNRQRKVIPFSPRRKAFLVAYAAAAVVILGLALSPLLLNQSHAPVDPAEAAGSMASRIETSEWPELVSTGLPERGASLTVRTDADRIAVELTVPPQGEVTLRWTGAPLTLLSAPPGASSAAGSAQYPAEGNQRSTFIFRAGGGVSEAHFLVLLDGEELLSISAPLN